MVTYPKDWKNEKLGSLLKIKRGASPRPIEQYLTNSINGINWIKIGDAPRDGKYIYSTREKVTSLGAKYSVIVLPGEFVLSNSMSFGRPYIVKEKGCIHDGWLKLFDFESTFTADYLYYLLSSDNIQIQYQSLAAGSGVQNLNKEIVKTVSVYIPTELKEQQAIADTLSTFDEHIENLTKLIEKKRAIRDGALEDLVTGKTRLDGFESHWKTSRLETLTKQIITGGTPSTAENKYWGGEIPWLSSTEIHQKRIKNPTSYITEAGLKNSSAKMAPPYSVVVALAGQGKTRGTVAILEREMALNQSLAAIVANESTDFTFLYYALEKGYEALRELSSGDGGRGGLNKKILREFEVKIPSSKTEQQAIASILTAMDDELIKLEHEREKIQQIKAGAMDDLLTGKIRLV